MEYFIGILLTFIFGIVPFIEIAKQCHKKEFSTLSFNISDYVWYTWLWIVASIIWPISLLISATVYFLLKKDNIF